ncbi:heavy metal translocating P-type ATPase [Fontivita pretiosa]|uniref:heavy metal translocating P-type ATPase n=1 Tax=Fontivita pretiosa TaxID=2989684 RepID=UPI003D169AAE
MAIQTFPVSAICSRDGQQHELCGRCLRERLLNQAGIRNVTLHPPTNGQALLELDYDPRLITLEQLNDEVHRAGFCLSPDRAEMVLGIDGMVSPRSEQVIETVLSKLPGVVASANFASRTLRIEFDRRMCALPEIARRLDEMGFRLRPADRQSPATRAHATSWLSRAAALAWEHHKITMALLGGLLLLGALIVHRTADSRLEWLRVALIVPAYFLTGWYTFRDTLRTLWNRQFDIDVLMFAAAIGAAVLGHYEEGGLLLLLFALGGAGEELAMDRARRAIQALAKLAPETATVRDADGSERLVRVEDLKVDDLVVVRPFDRIPADGLVASGTSSVDQSPITGESVPVEKTPGSQVFAGTINGEGLLVVRVSRPASQTTLAKIIRMVNEAQTTKSPTQVFTDAVERRYVPIVLIATAALIAVPPLFDGAWATWFYRAMAFLTAASPCALAIGTPAAVLSGIARAARGGVLVKGGVHLENLGRVNAIAFDKTGTLTRGRAQVTELLPLNGRPAGELLALAAAVERGSSHPLAKAIVAEAQARQCAELVAVDVEQIPGQGVTGRVNGSTVAVGHVDLISPSHPDLPRVQQHIDSLASRGCTTVVLVIDQVPEAVIGLADRPRDNAARTIARLRQIGIARTIMLTGDSRQVADAIARQVGVDEHHGDLLPEDKVRIIREAQQRYGPIAMVGDGVNDAPAMATAAVGVAMGGAGTDVAIETADVALMADDLEKLPDAIGLSRFSRRIIMQNLFIALGVILVLAPLSALGYTYLGVAVLFHEGSTVLVVLNAMRLLVYRTR